MRLSVLPLAIDTIIYGLTADAPVLEMIHFCRRCGAMVGARAYDVSIGRPTPERLLNDAAEDADAARRHLEGHR